MPETVVFDIFGYQTKLLMQKQGQIFEKVLKMSAKILWAKLSLY